MKNKNIIFNELMEISPLIVQIEKVNVYSVQGSYFNNLSRKVFEKIEREKGALNVLSPAAPYQTPTGYFENLSAAIFKKISSESQNFNSVYNETALIAPVLNTINKKQVYSIPADFFKEQLISLSAGAMPKAKVSAFYKRSGFFRISVAAVVTALLATGLYTITGKDFQTSTTDYKTKKEVRNLSKEEIVTFLRSSSSVENINSASENTNEIKSSLKEISDKEIQQYLKETGEGDDI